MSNPVAPDAASITAAMGTSTGAIGGYSIPVWRNPPAVKNTGGAGSSAAADNQYSLAHPAPEKSYASADAQAQFGRILMDPQLMSVWQDTALKAGLVNASNVNNATALGAAWDESVKRAVMFATISGGKTLMTPFEAAKLVGETSGAQMLATQSLAAAQAKRAAETFTGTKDLGTTTSVDKSVPSGSQEALRQLLGRNATPGELAAYNHGLNTTAAANPNVKHSTGTFVNGQQTSQQDTLSGGYDATAAEQQAASSASPQVAAHQSATTYYSALVQALQAAA